MQYDKIRTFFILLTTQKFLLPTLNDKLKYNTK